ncbi:MAG: hypothetical protein DIU60_007035 [Actinomycetes bacterium]|jgi:hypothetical protein|nr:MAG: hypothetical protein DIU60_07365 [Actinomycetota bacterium]
MPTITEPGGPGDHLLLPVPAQVSVSYVVAAPERVPDDPADTIAHVVAGLPFPDGRDSLTVTVTEIGEQDPALAWAREVLCCPECTPGAGALLGRLLQSSDRHLRVTATAAPGWPPRHLYAAARVVDTLADTTGGIPLDAEAPRILPLPWRPTVAASPDKFAIAEWLWIGIHPETAGHSIQTTGLARLGLPELRVEEVPLRHATAWIRLVKGLARSLTARLFTHLSARDPVTPLPVPVEPVVTTADAALAQNAPPPPEPRALTVRLRREPPSPGVPVPHLVVTPADGDPADCFRPGGWPAT